LKGGVKPTLLTGAENSHLITLQVACRAVFDNMKYKKTEKKSMIFAFLYIYPGASCCGSWQNHFGNTENLKTKSRAMENES